MSDHMPEKNIVSLDERRAAQSGDAPARCVTCGDEWFELVPVQGIAGLTLRSDGTVSGYCGGLKCLSCGTMP